MRRGRVGAVAWMGSLVGSCGGGRRTRGPSPHLPNVVGSVASRSGSNAGSSPGHRALRHRFGVTGQYSTRDAGTDKDPGQARVSVTR